MSNFNWSCMLIILVVIIVITIIVVMMNSRSSSDSCRSSLGLRSKKKSKNLRQKSGPEKKFRSSPSADQKTEVLGTFDNTVSAEDGSKINAQLYTDDFSQLSKDDSMFDLQNGSSTLMPSVEKFREFQEENDLTGFPVSADYVKMLPHVNSMCSQVDRAMLSTRTVSRHTGSTPLWRGEAALKKNRENQINLLSPQEKKLFRMMPDLPEEVYLAASDSGSIYPSN